MNKPTSRTCWCGNADLVPFSPAYLRCASCESLIVARVPAVELSRVENDETDFYGREYWFSHQEQDLGFTNIAVRARTDLSERCVHWLQALLRFKRPPARTLELGCAHGGFVALMQWAGFHATGLELSPWIAKFAEQTFGVPMLTGPVEDQSIEPQSLDVIALMDVLEHLSDPAGTMAHCLSLLKSNGFLLIQTPRYPEGMDHAALVERSDPFLEQLKHDQHLHLFSRKSVTELFRRLNAPYVRFEPPMFPHYDMFFLASREPIMPLPTADEAVPGSTGPIGRLVQALLDLDNRLQETQQRLVESEHDRSKRLEVIQRQGAELDRIPALEAALAAAESDRAARLEVIQRQGEALARIGELEATLAWSESDRAARLEVIVKQAGEIARLESALGTANRDSSGEAKSGSEP